VDKVFWHYGISPGAVFPTESAMERLLIALYVETTMPEYPRPLNSPLHERNQANFDACQQGETLSSKSWLIQIAQRRLASPPIANRSGLLKNWQIRDNSWEREEDSNNAWLRY
jgi:hypothetical protein